MKTRHGTGFRPGAAVLLGVVPTLRLNDEMHRNLGLLSEKFGERVESAWTIKGRTSRASLHEAVVGIRMSQWPTGRLMLMFGPRSEPMLRLRVVPLGT